MGDKGITSALFLVDPVSALMAGDQLGAFDGPDGPKLPEETDEAEAGAKRKEQERLRRGRSTTQLSGSLGQALNASIGKRTLGGAL